MSLIKKLDLLADSPFRNADAIPLPFPPTPPPSQPEDVSESEDEDGDEDEDETEALVRKPKDAAGTKSLLQDDQVLDLTHDEEDEGVVKEATPEKASSDVPPAEKSFNETLAEIDAEIVAEKAAEASTQQSSEPQTQPTATVEES